MVVPFLRLMCAILASAFLPMPTLGQVASAPPRVMSVVPFAPTPFAATGGIHLEYELHITNLTGPAFHIREVDVATDDGLTIGTYRDQVLSNSVEQPGARRRAVGALSRTPSDFERYMAWQAEYDATLIEPGTLAVLFLRLVLDRSEPVPDLIRHRITIEYEGAGGALEERVIEANATTPRAQALELGPPLRGGDWWAYNRSDTAAHNRGVGQFGDVYQRFAIDYNRVDAFGHRFSGDPYVVGNHRSLGADVLAVADGVVLSADGSAPPGEIGRRTPGVANRGNYVNLAIGGGVYATYMHLQAGSVTVQEGDSVRRGQVIGRIGQTGASQVPHLHFQINEGWRGPEGWRHSRREGLPYVHPVFEVLGDSEDALATYFTPSPYCDCVEENCEPRSPERRTGEMPKGNVVIRFPNDSGDEGRLEDDTDRVTAICSVREARLLTEQYRIPEAIAALEKARALHAELAIPDQDWRALCWRGTIAGQAADVLSACDAAVAQEPEFGAHLSARGIGRALSGDVRGAISDLEAYLTWQVSNPSTEGSSVYVARQDGLDVRSAEELRSQVEAWLEELRAGRNPFSEEFLEELRGRR